MARKKVTKSKARHPRQAQLPSTPPAHNEGRWVQASSDKILGEYANVAQITHTSREFILDFLFALDGNAFLTSRIITSPPHAKELHRVLGENIDKYEKKHGKIGVGGDKHNT